MNKEYAVLSSGECLVSDENGTRILTNSDNIEARLVEQNVLEKISLESTNANPYDNKKINIDNNNLAFKEIKSEIGLIKFSNVLYYILITYYFIKLGVDSNHFINNLTWHNYLRMPLDALVVGINSLGLYTNIILQSKLEEQQKSYIK